MPDLSSIHEAASTLTRLLGLSSPPVAVAFVDRAPSGVARVQGMSPAGCGYWSRAAAGEVFYTEAADHATCPIGAHTHAVPLSPETAEALEGLVETMVGLEYVTADEIARIPRRRTPFRAAVYAPLDRTPCEPDVALVRGSARQVMLLVEAAQAAGVGPDGAVMGRPTCAAVPAAEQRGRAAVSLGCVGNRVYTGLGDGELYATVPGPALAAVVGRLATIVRANHELERFHRGRRGP